MSPQPATQRVMAEPPYFITIDAEVTVEAVTEAECAEVLAFLAERPTHTVVMAGFIRDHGLISPLNRGTFYACRNRAGRIEGVALVGHATLLETRTTAPSKPSPSRRKAAPTPT